MIKIVDAILALDANAEVSITDNSVDNIIWHDSNPNNITKEQINSKVTELQTAYDNKKYQRDRAAEYPSWQDQLDKIYHDGIDAWKADIKAIKDKYPKP